MAATADSNPAAPSLPGWEPALLGEKIWLDWRSDDLPPGPVAAWADRAGGVVAAQTDARLQPVKLASGEVVFHSGGRGLVIPAQSRGFLAHRAVLEDHADLAGYQVYACGAPAMIDAARAEFVERGLSAEEFFADAFTFAPVASAPALD